MKALIEMKRILILNVFILVFTSTHILAQTNFRDGYIITIKNDTIHGLINYEEGSQSETICDFKKDNTKDITNYSPYEIQGYRFKNDKYIIAKDIAVSSEKTDRVFMEVLVKGAATLFKFNNVFYLEKEDSEMYSLTNEEVKVINKNDGIEYFKRTNQYIGRLTFLLNDCNDIQAKVRRLKLSEEPLTKLIEEYNECMNSTSITYKADKPWGKSSIGIVTGVNFSSFKLDSYLSEFRHLNGKYDASTSPLFGLSLELSAPRINERYSLSIDAYYLSSKYTSYNEEEAGGTTLRNDLYFEFNQLKIPIAFRYTFRERKVAPYFNLGFSGTIHLNSVAQWTRETENSMGVNTEVLEAMDVSSGQIGYWAGIGLKKTISKKLTGYIETRFEKTFGISKTVNIESDITNFQVLVGISY